eukprot:GHUV01050756.1.p1 GENE.GHUV01050756.1~~GHUV01050756.1.p1  ORF type:complete len:113 (-),score=35.25 GHUV01050756.1:85-423(-)
MSIHFNVVNSRRYKNFLGLNNPNDFMAAAAEMKRKGDFTSLSTDTSTIAAVRAAGMPADKVLGLSDNTDADAAARYVPWLWKDALHLSLLDLKIWCIVASDALCHTSWRYDD